LNFVAAKGDPAGSRTADAIAKIFASTLRDDIRDACLASLFKIESKAAENALAGIYNDKTFDARWREAASQYLKRVRENGHSQRRPAGTPVSELN
jgi:hypothetical protein